MRANVIWTVRHDTTRFYVDAAAFFFFFFFFTKYRMIPLNCFSFTDGYPQRPEINLSRWAIPKDKNMLMSDHVKNICKNKTKNANTMKQNVP